MYDVDVCRYAGAKNNEIPRQLPFPLYVEMSEYTMLKLAKYNNENEKM